MPKEIITTTFKAILSTKHEIPLDPNEVQLLQAAVETGSPVQVKRGIINPSYLVAIVEDKDRRAIFLEDTKHEPKRRIAGMQPLKDIFFSGPALPPERTERG